MDSKTLETAFLMIFGGFSCPSVHCHFLSFWVLLLFRLSQSQLLSFSIFALFNSSRNFVGFHFLVWLFGYMTWSWTKVCTSIDHWQSSTVHVEYMKGYPDRKFLWPIIDAVLISFFSFSMACLLEMKKASMHRGYSEKPSEECITYESKFG